MCISLHEIHMGTAICSLNLMENEHLSYKKIHTFAQLKFSAFFFNFISIHGSCFHTRLALYKTYKTRRLTEKVEGKIQLFRFLTQISLNSVFTVYSAGTL